MSHRPQRKDRNCLNCGTEVVGKFCHECGQENAHPKETFWHLLQHLFSDLTHFDGKLWHSARYLILKPGFLSAEFINGRRMKYVNPISFYFFTSAVFFLIFSTVFNSEGINVSNGISLEKINKLTSEAFQKKVDSLAPGKKLTRQELKLLIDSVDNHNSVFGIIDDYKSREQYDSLIRSGKIHHNWVVRHFNYKLLDISQRYKNNGQGLSRAIIDKFIHSLPKMLFILLPLFAMVLKLVYIRRPQFYFVDHIIFTLHIYIFTFISLIVIFGLNKLNGWLHWGLITFLSTTVSFAIFFYFYKALRNFYKQRRIKTILKFIILCFLLFMITLVLFTLFILFSFLQL